MDEEIVECISCGTQGFEHRMWECLPPTNFPAESEEAWYVCPVCMLSKFGVSIDD